MLSSNDLKKVIQPVETDNSAAEMIARSSGFHIDKEMTVTGTGSVTANVLEFTGTIVILNQWAVITRVGTLTNLTAMCATAYDGTNTVNLTADGAVLSGATVGSFFTKDKVASQPYTVSLSDEVRVIEELTDKKSGRPFTLTAKEGASNYIQLNFTTTDNPVDFDVKIHFEYYPVNGSTLEFL